MKHFYKTTVFIVFLSFSLSVFNICEADNRGSQNNFFKIDRTSNKKFIIVSSNRKPPKVFPDGTTKRDVMSIDFKQTDVYNFFAIMSEVSGRRIFVCKNISGRINRYRAIDKSFYDIFSDIADIKQWKVSYSREKIEVCSLK